MIITVKEIKGKCPVFKVGDKFEIREGYRLVSKITLCMHALSSLMPYYNALRFTEPDSLGLAAKDDKSRAYIQCPDPVKYTGGGTVVFEISKVR